MVVEAKCVHKWVLESPGDDAPEEARTQGRCRLCGAERSFEEQWKNSWVHGAPIKAERARRRGNEKSRRARVRHGGSEATGGRSSAHASRGR